MHFMEQREKLLGRKDEIDRAHDAILDLMDHLELKKDEAIQFTFRQVSFGRLMKLYSLLTPSPLSPPHLLSPLPISSLPTPSPLSLPTPSPLSPLPTPSPLLSLHPSYTILFLLYMHTYVRRYRIISLRFLRS